MSRAPDRSGRCPHDVCIIVWRLCLHVRQQVVVDSRFEMKSRVPMSRGMLVAGRSPMHVLRWQHQ